jgi:serine/threonine protein kinase
MSIDLVRGELERLYSLDELLSLTRDLLGFEPNEVGGTASKASFARALSDHCLEVDAFDALVDALLASRPDLDTRLRDLGALSHEELKAGETFGKFTITKKLGDGPNGVVYLAKADGHDKVLKIVGRLAAGSRRSVRRYVTHVRLAASVKHESLAQGLESGFVGRHAWSAYDHVEGQPLGARIARTGPLHVNEARGLLRGVLGALGALHAAHLFHGAVKIENVLVSRGSDGQPRALLVDVGGGFLAPMALSGQGGPWSTSGFVKAKSPEQLRGKTADARSDLYTFGALLFEVLTGKTPFSGETGTDIAIAHLTQPAPAPSTLAPRGWVAKELDELCDRLMQKSPGARPKDVAEVTQALEAVGKPAAKEAKKAISEDDITARIDALVADPSDKEAALTLESAVELGADAAKVADAFSMAADSIEAGESEGDKIKATEAKKALLYRAARIFESAKVPARAEETYAAIVALDGEDEVALTALEELRRVLGKHEELVEMLLERSEKSESHAERARALHQIGHLYARELEDKEQGVFAFAQALAQETPERRLRGRSRARRGQGHEALGRGAPDPQPGDHHPTCRPRPRSRSSRGSATGTRRRSRARTWACPASRRCSPSTRRRRRPRGHGAGLPPRAAVAGARAGAPLAAPIARPPPPGARISAPRPPTPRDQAQRRRSARAICTSRSSTKIRATKACEALARIYQQLEDTRARQDPRAQARGAARRGTRRGDLQASPSSTRTSSTTCRGHAPLRGRARARPDEPHGAARPRPHLQPQRPLQGAAREPRAIRSSSPRRRARRSTSTSASPASTTRSSSTTRRPPRPTRRSSRSTPPTRAISALVRHYRALDRWEDVAALYERHLKHRHRGRVSRGAAARPRPRARSRSARRSARAKRTSACSRSIRTTAAPSSRSPSCARRRATRWPLSPPSSRSRRRPRPPRTRRISGSAPPRCSRRRATATAPSSATRPPSTPSRTTRPPRSRCARPTSPAATPRAPSSSSRARSTSTATSPRRASTARWRSSAREGAGRQTRRGGRHARRSTSIRRTCSGLLITGDLAFEAGALPRGREVVRVVANRVDAMPKEDAFVCWCATSTRSPRPARHGEGHRHGEDAARARARRSEAPSSAPRGQLDAGRAQGGREALRGRARALRRQAHDTDTGRAMLGSASRG